LLGELAGPDHPEADRPLIDRQALHAHTLHLQHPLTGQELMAAAETLDAELSGVTRTERVAFYSRIEARGTASASIRIRSAGPVKSPVIAALERLCSVAH